MSANTAGGGFKKRKIIYKSCVFLIKTEKITNLFL